MSHDGVTPVASASGVSAIYAALNEAAAVPDGVSDGRVFTHAFFSE
jgi:hypothetical protein